MQVNKLSGGIPSLRVIVKVPPLPVVTKSGGPGLAAKVNVTVVPTAMLVEVGLTVMDVTSPITVTEALPLTP